MNHLRLEVVDEKHLRLGGIDPFVAACLQELPSTLARRDDPVVRPRLFPDPADRDEPAADEWLRLVEPDLRHLLVSAGETVARDLTALGPESTETGCLEILFPEAHRDAWMSAVNQARLILGELHEVTEADMNGKQFNLRDPKQLAVLKIQLLGYILHLLIAQESGETGDPA